MELLEGDYIEQLLGRDSWPSDHKASSPSRFGSNIKGVSDIILVVYDIILYYISSTVF